LASLGYWIFFPWPKIDLKENKIIAEGLCCPPKNITDEECFIINTNNKKLLVEQIEFLPEPLKDSDWFFHQYAGKNTKRFKFTFENKKLDELVKSGFGINYGSKKTLEPFRIEDTFFYKEDNLPVPYSKNILRIATIDSAETFRLVGFTIFVHLDIILRKYFQKSITDFKNVCDWGCGCGRLTRYLTKYNEIKLTGLDVDYDNIKWCQNNLLNSSFLTIKQNPPVLLNDNSFDLIIGISIFTHLPEKNQFEWLEELKRLAAKGATVIVTINSLKAWVLTRQSDENTFKIFTEKGIYDKFPNKQIENKIGNNVEYVNTFHSHQYIKKNWSEFFEIIDIVDGGIGGYQDVIVMKNV